MTPSGSAGSVGGTAQKNGIVVCAAKSATGRVKRTISRLPRATTPAGVAALPACTSAAPTMCRVYAAPGDSTPGASVRLIARANALAPSGLPSLKRKLFRRVNVNVLPSREALGGRTATSGTSRNPPGNGLSA